LRIENDVAAARAVAEVENFLPGFAAITRAEDAALGVRAVRVPESGDIGDIGTRRMDDDLADGGACPSIPTLFQVLAAVVRTIDAIAEGDVAANAAHGADIITLDRSWRTAMLPMREVVCLSKRGSRKPPSMVFQTPPAAAPK